MAELNEIESPERAGRRIVELSTSVVEQRGVERPPLIQMLVRALAPAVARRLESLPQLEATLTQLLVSAAAWPELPVESSRFLCHLGQMLKDASHPGDRLKSLHAADLWLAMECAAGHPQAIRLFLQGPFGAAQGVLKKLESDSIKREELEARLSEMLLVGGGRPRIADFGGRGELRSWVASIAIRQARRTGLRGLPAERRPDELLAQAASNEDVELAYLRQMYGGEFASAVSHSLPQLTVRERNLLRQHHLDALSLDEIAALYSVHRATAARWLAAARARVCELTLKQLSATLSVKPAEAISLSRLVREDLHISLRRLLAPSS